MKRYEPKQFPRVKGLSGISDSLLQDHFKLYEGYVKGTNDLSERIAAILSDGQVDKEEMPAYSELTRRLGFEYNGMVLHEYYFGNMTKNAGGQPASGVQGALGSVYGDFETWKKDFSAVGGMRGVGWAIAYYDPHSQRVSNHWITLHEDGNVAGFVPLLVMDVWEHAFMRDYKATEKAKYVEAFWNIVNWEFAESNLK